MKTYLQVLIVSIVLCYLAFYYDPYIPTKINPEQTKQLAQLIQPIRTIDPVDTNYHDLQFLKEKLKDVDIVMLGEQQHGDGSTFLAKSRLIKYLHQELNFDVLLFESGIYDCSLLWNRILGNPTAKLKNFREALFYFWGESNETKSLRTYIMQHAQSTSSLILGGFDQQFSGDMSDSLRLNLMESYLAKKTIHFKKSYPSFLKILKNYHYNTYSSNRLTEAEKQAVFNEIERLKTVLTRDIRTNEDQIFARYILGIQADLRSKWSYPGNSYKQGIIRDSLMAANVIWLKDHLYKNKRIIIWAANYHITYNSKRLNTPTDRADKMGDYLRRKYNARCYGINFTSYSGTTYNVTTGEPNLINQSISNSIESMLHTMKQPFAFIDFRTTPKGSFLNEKVTMKFLGHNNHTERWSQMMDALFFHRSNEADHF